MKTATTYYHTKDIWAASILYAKSKKLSHTDNDNGTIWFSFDDKEDCEKLVDAFWRKDLNCNAKELVDSIKTLKSMVFNKEHCYTK